MRLELEDHIFSKSGTSSLVHALKSDYIFIEGNFTLVEKYTINNSEVYAWNYSLTTDVAIQRKASSCPEVEKVRIYDVCTTFFSHPSGLGFAYSLARTNRSIEDYVKILEETHEVLEAIFVTENPDQSE